MTCPKCKSEQPDTAQFCSQCAEPLTEHGKIIARPKNNPLPWVLLLVVLLVVLAMFVQRSVQHSERQKDAAQRTMVGQQPRPESTPIPQPEPSPIPTPQAHLTTIAGGATVVAATSYSWYTFVVPPNVNTVAINGRFTATGGANDIVCYILDEDGFVNFKNGHSARAYYNSGKVTVAQIGAANLPPGTYYLVLDNRYSLLTPKAVQIDATLSYLQ